MRNEAEQSITSFEWNSMNAGKPFKIDAKKKKEPVVFLTMAARYCEILGFRKQAPPASKFFVSKISNLRPVQWTFTQVQQWK